jgi:hypothetical protein
LSRSSDGGLESASGRDRGVESRGRGGIGAVHGAGLRDGDGGFGVLVDGLDAGKGGVDDLGGGRRSIRGRRCSLLLLRFLGGGAVVSSGRAGRRGRGSAGCGASGGGGRGGDRGTVRVRRRAVAFVDFDALPAASLVAVLVALGWVVVGDAHVLDVHVEGTFVEVRLAAGPGYGAFSVTLGASGPAAELEAHGGLGEGLLFVRGLFTLFALPGVLTFPFRATLSVYLSSRTTVPSMIHWILSAVQSRE